MTDDDDERGERREEEAQRYDITLLVGDLEESAGERGYLLLAEVDEAVCHVFPQRALQGTAEEEVDRLRGDIVAKVWRAATGRDPSPGLAGILRPNWREEVWASLGHRRR